MQMKVKIPGYVKVHTVAEISSGDVWFSRLRATTLISTERCFLSCNLCLLLKDVEDVSLVWRVQLTWNTGINE